MSRSFLVHLHPTEVEASTLRFRTTFGLGFIAVILFLVLTFTGLFLMLYYVPAPNDARGSILDIEFAVTFGAFARALHRIAANILIFCVFLHLIRVWLTGVFIGRTTNRLIGIALFLVTLGLGFTGYLLPWDQLSYWATTVSANLADHVPFAGGILKRFLLGDNAIGGASLLRFYALHVAVLPCLMLGLIVYHLWRIRRDGGLARAKTASPPCDMVPTQPHLLIREAVLTAAVLLSLCFAALFIPAPIGGPLDMHHPSNPEKTPWYFLFLQEMVSYSTLTGGFIFPMILIAIPILVPLLDTDTRHRGQWFGGPKERLTFFLSLAGGGIAFVCVEFIFQTAAVTRFLSNAATGFRDVFNPATGMLLVAAAGGVLSGTMTKSRRAALSAISAVLLAAVIGFTVMGALRGPGWILVLPWEEAARVQ